MQFRIVDKTSLQYAIHELCAHLREEGIAESNIFDSRLVANELLGNVFKHSGGEAQLAVEIKEEIIQITMHSTVPFQTPKVTVCSDVYAEHGRGLFLVDKVSLKRMNLPDGGICVLIRRQ